MARKPGIVAADSPIRGAKPGLHEGEGRVMKTRARRRRLRRLWRVMTWPLSGHIALALGSGLAFGIADAHYPW